jgi:hypothetical protein
VSANEKLLLRLLLANPEAPDALIPGLQTIAAIAQMPTHRIFEALFAQHVAGARIGFNEIHDRLNEEDRALLAATVLLDETGEADQSVEQGLACLRGLQASEIESQRAALKARIKEAGRNGDMHEALRLSEELDRIKRLN